MAAGTLPMNTEALTDTKRLAYILPHETQESSSRGSRTQGGPNPDEEYDSRGADQARATGSQGALEQEGGKERVPIRRRLMTRSTFQKGYVFARMTEHGKVHVIRYRVRSTGGKWRHRAETVRSPRRKDAERILSDRLREVNLGLRLPAETSFADYAANQWEAYISQNLKPSTQASHRSNVKAHILPMFGKLRLSEISPLLIMDFLKQKSVAGLRPKSLLNLYVLLQKMLNLAVALELLNSNPIQRVPKPKAERIEKPAISPNEVKGIAGNMPRNLKALIVLLYLTGVRIGEALALKWSDVDFEQSKLYIRRSVWRGKEQSPKSRRSIRAKHLLDGLQRVLQSHRELCVGAQPEDYVFANGAGRPYDPDDLRKRVLYPAMDKAGIERKLARAYGFHLFRHSAGTQMHEVTGDLKQTQSFLGHSGIGITSDVYVHLQPDSEVGSMEKLENAFFGELCSTVLKRTDEIGLRAVTRVVICSGNLLRTQTKPTLSGDISGGFEVWLRGVDLNHRPLGYEPNELPDCSTPR
jgi:integrase